MLSKSTYGTLRSALTHLYKMASQEMPDKFRQEMSTFNRGIRRKVTQEKWNQGLAWKRERKQ